MRILVAHLVPAARTGGMSRLMGKAHDLLAARGHHVDYLTADDVPAASRGRAGRFTFMFQVRKAAAEAVRRGQPYDIVNVHEPHGAAIALRRGGLGGAAVVVMSHGVERRGWEVALAHGPSRPSLKTRIVYPTTSLWLSTLALRHADHIVCLNRQDRDYLGARFGIEPARVTPVTPGADPLFGGAAAARSYGRGQRLLFAGTWLARKGAMELAQAFDAMIAAGRDVELRVVGAGVPEAQVRSAFTPRAAARVEVLGSGGDDLMAAALADADVFVLPSLFEGTPLTLIEAMWSGLPVVTTRTAGMQDVVSDGDTGLLVPPGDAAALQRTLERVTADADLRSRLGQSAHRQASASYTWPRAADTFERAYTAARTHGSHDRSAS